MHTREAVEETSRNSEINMLPLTRSKVLRNQMESRQHPRLPYQHAVRILALNGAMAGVNRVNTYDLSTGGLGFISDRRFSRDDQLVFALHRGSHTVIIRCEVVHCRLLPNGMFKTGTRFMDMVSHVRGQEQIPASWLGFQIDD